MINKRSNDALVNNQNIKAQADIHVNRIEKASEIGKNLTNEINSARDQVGKLLEQVKSLQSSLSKTKKKSMFLLERSIDSSHIIF